MDPVSIIGLVVSVTGLIHTTRRVVEFIHGLKTSERAMIDLSNDLCVFGEALNGFERVMRSRTTFHRIPAWAIDTMIKDSTQTMQDLQTRLEEICESNISAVRQARWVQHSSKIDKLHNRLKEQNMRLLTFLSVSHADTLTAFTGQLPQYIVSDDSDPTSALLVSHDQDSNMLQVPRPGNKTRRFSGASSIATVESLAETTFSIGSASAVSSASSMEPPEQLPHRASHDSAWGGSSGTVSVYGSTDDYVQTPIEVRKACHYSCHCACHRPGNVRSAHRGLAIFKTKLRCTDSMCRNNEASHFPSMKQYTPFRNALSQALSAKSIDIRYNLNTYRMVPEGSDAMRHIKHGDLDRLKACIDAGDATIWDTAPDGWSLLHTAAYNRQLPIVKYLLQQGVDTEVGDVGSRKPADLAILKSIGQDATELEHDIVRVFSEKDDCLTDFDFTPIHIAVLDMYGGADLECPSLEALIELLDEANNAPPTTNWAKWKHRYANRSPLFVSILEYFRSSAFERPKGTKVIHNLLDKKDKKFDWTPLHWAASAGQVEKMRTLVKRGADPLILSNLNANIIHAAAESKIERGLSGALEIWRHCKGRLDINQINRWNETPLHVAAWCSSACVKLLLEAGADPDSREENGQVPLHCAGLSEHGLDRRKIAALLCATPSKLHINAQDQDGRPPIFDFLDDQECVEILIQNGARLDLTDDTGRNVFHRACMQDESEALAILLQGSDHAELAIAKDDAGNSPLLEALSNSHIECSMMLLRLEDVGEIIGKDGWAAIHYAAKIGDADLLEAVCRHKSFLKGMKTIDEKRADVVAMEAGNWHGRIKDLIREYDYISWTE